MKIIKTTQKSVTTEYFQVKGYCFFLKMLRSQLIIHVLIPLVQLLVGIVANSIILAVNGMELVKKRRMSPLGLLLFCVAFSRFCLQLIIFYINLALVSLVEVNLFAENIVIVMFINESGIWFATWLSVFYCTKITTIAHPLFFWLKMRISKLVPWLILGSLLFSSGNAVFHSKYTWIVAKDIWLSLYSKNATKIQIREIPAFQFVFVTIGMSLPFSIFFISMLLLIFSLGRHIWKMRNIAMGIRDPNRSVHLSVLLSMLCFLLLYVAYYLSAALFSSQIFKFRIIMLQLCLLAIGMYPSGHSIILILGNQKLARSAKAFFQYWTWCLRDNQDPLKEWVAQCAVVLTISSSVKQSSFPVSQMSSKDCPN